MKQRRTLFLSLYTVAVGAVFVLGPTQAAAEQQAPGQCYQNCSDGMFEHHSKCDLWTQTVFCEYDNYNCPPAEPARVYCGAAM
jgi:hypothetical protein